MEGPSGFPAASRGRLPAVCKEEQINVTRFRRCRRLVRSVKRKALPTPIMLDSSQPGRGLSRTAAAAIAFPGTGDHAKSEHWPLRTGRGDQKLDRFFRPLSFGDLSRARCMQRRTACEARPQASHRVIAIQLGFDNKTTDQNVCSNHAGCKSSAGAARQALTNPKK